MQRLTGMDAGFLYMETPSSPMHVAGLAVYEPSGSTDASFERIRTMVESRLHLAPPFRRRLVTVPFQLHHPLWIEDPDFDLDWHLRRIAVPSPGGRRELADLAAHLDALPLDRSRPLWEMWVIEGLDDGNIATLTKVHHAAIDGASGNQITIALLDLSPEVADPPPPAEEWKPDRVPSDVELVNYAVASLARQPWRVAKAARRTVAAALNIRQLSRNRAVTPPAPFSAPSTSINGALTPARSYAMTSLSLNDVKKVKNAFSATVNDVVLAMCAGALRRYFDGRGEHLDRPLVAMVPVSVRTEADKDTMGNQVASAFTSLATDIDDPVVRLLAIHESMAGAKEQQKAIPADVLQDWAEFAAPAVFSRAARLYSRTRLADRHRPAFNLTISNVPGPPFPLWSAGARLVANYPLGPVSEGLGLNITVMSLQDQLDFGLLASPKLVSDVWIIADGLGEALEELVAAADRLTERQAGAGATPPDPAPALASRSDGTLDDGAHVAPAPRPSAPVAAKTAGAPATAVATTSPDRPVERTRGAAASAGGRRPATKAVAAKTAGGKRPATKAVAAKTAGGKRPATKAVAAKTAGGKRPATKAVAAKTVGERSPAAGAAAEAGAKPAARRPPAKKAAPRPGAAGR